MLGPMSHRMTGRLGCVCAVFCLPLVLLASGCGRAAPTPEPVTIKFAFPAQELPNYQQSVELFRAEHPYITVELVPKPGDMLAGIDAEGADVFATSEFALNWMQEQGAVLNLSPFIEQDATIEASDFYPGILGLFTSDGKTWAVPAGVDILVMYFNRDLLARYGAPDPQIGWTWDDLLSTAAALRDADAGVFGYAPNPMFDVIALVYQHGGRIFDDLQNPARTTFDDPLNIEALEWYSALMHEYDVVPTPDEARLAFGGSGDPQVGAFAGKVGMWTGMLSQRGGRLSGTEWGMSWGVAPLPRDARSATLTLVDGYFISSQTQHREASWQWIVFLSKQMPYRLAPARRSLAESADYERLVGADIAAVTRASMEEALLLSPKLAEFEQALGVFQNAVEQIANQRATPEEALTQAQRRFEQ